MRKRIRNLIGILVMTAVIVFSIIQLNIPSVSAEICPPGYSVGCGCMFEYGIDSEYQGVLYRTCYYTCGGCSGGWEPMSIVVEY